MTRVLLAFCTHNRAERLPALVRALRAQTAALSFDLVAVNNASRDGTASVLAELAHDAARPLRVVHEATPGIVPARNRVLREAAGYDILICIDDDELPHPGYVAAAIDAVLREGADCAGGKIHVDFTDHARPGWLGDDLLGFLAALDHGPDPFWIESEATPLWTSNIVYRMDFLRRHRLEFDSRYNRLGASASDAGGGEDAMMFRRLLALGARVRYRPDMQVDHAVERGRLKRRYFLRLHHLAGVRKGLHEVSPATRLLGGAPAYLYSQLLVHCLRTLPLALRGSPRTLRQAMNAAHALGLIRGYRRRMTEGEP